MVHNDVLELYLATSAKCHPMDPIVISSDNIPRAAVIFGKKGGWHSNTISWLQQKGNTSFHGLYFNITSTL